MTIMRVPPGAGRKDSTFWVGSSPERLAGRSTSVAQTSVEVNPGRETKSCVRGGTVVDDDRAALGVVPGNDPAHVSSSLRGNVLVGHGARRTIVVHSSRRRSGRSD
jgi:hypothetical protein